MLQRLAGVGGSKKEPSAAGINADLLEVIAVELKDISSQAWPARVFALCAADDEE